MGALAARPNTLVADLVPKSKVRDFVRIHDADWTWRVFGKDAALATQVLHAAPTFMPGVEMRPVQKAIAEAGDVLLLAPLTPHAGECSAPAPLSGSCIFSAVSYCASRYRDDSHCGGARWAVWAHACRTAAEHAFCGREAEEGFRDAPVKLRGAYAGLFAAGDEVAAAQGASLHAQRLGARSAAAAAAASRESAAWAAYERALAAWAAEVADREPH